METDIVHATAQYVEEVLGSEGLRYASAVVANCKMLALQLEAQEDVAPIDMEALVVSAYLHDISNVAHGFADHHRKSADMALSFLQREQAPDALAQKVEQIILTHTLQTSDTQPDVPVEARLLYDADKLGRLSGLAVVTSLIEFGARYPNRAVNGDVLAAVLRHVEERFIELYQSLQTDPARDMAQEKFHRTLAFLDGVIEHLSDATPV
jgi:HD superfamily phosphodiesterase